MKANSLLEDVCINCCGSATSFLKGKEGLLKGKERKQARAELSQAQPKHGLEIELVKRKAEMSSN